MVANSSEVGVRIGEAVAKLAASCDQDDDSAKLAILGSIWKVLGACWGHFGTILAHGLDSRKPTKTTRKPTFFGIWGPGRGR